MIFPDLHFVLDFLASSIVLIASMLAGHVLLAFICSIHPPGGKEAARYFNAQFDATFRPQKRDRKAKVQEKPNDQ